jgi:hydroxyethylthiazole kinase-like uncharacterized protein yjeF
LSPKNAGKMLARVADFAFADALCALPARDERGNKGTFGTLTAVCGSVPYRGAAVLAVSAALRCGVGIVRLAAPECVVAACAAQVCECIFLPLPDCPDGLPLPGQALEAMERAAAGSTALLLGCGLGNSARTRSIVEWAAEHTEGIPVLLDADALNCMQGDIKPLEKLGARATITPHVGEFSRLTGLGIGEIKENPAGSASEFASRLGCTVVLKDFVTHIASPDGEVLRCGAPNSGLAKGGSGDVLAGITASLLAQGVPPKLAAAAGCALHAEAARRASERLTRRAMLPSDIIAELPGVFAAEVM